MSPNDLTQRSIYRMVHYENIEYILKNGMCCQSHPLADPNYIDIGYAKLISQRKEYKVRIDPPNGNFGDCVPFYFGGHSPMLLNIKTGERDITRRPQEDIVFVCCKIFRIVYFCEAQWCFTDGHAKAKNSAYYNNVQELVKIDWQMVFEQWWRNTADDNDRERRKQAEFLVKYYVPVNCFHGLLVKNQQRKEGVERIVTRLGLKIPVKADTNNQLFYP